MMMTTPNSSKRAAGHLRHSLFALFSIAFLLVIGIADATNESGTKYLEEKSTEADVVTLPSGLRYKVLEKGNGAFHPTVSSPCACHYAGTLIDGTEFDSSYSRGSPSTFAPNQVIKGWTQAMQLMVEGDKWELYIPSDLAYGSRGSPPTIPGDSALVFTIEMIEIQGEKVIATVAERICGSNYNDALVGTIYSKRFAYGDRGRPPQIPSRSALVFTLEMVKIKGEKVVATVADDTELSATNPDNVIMKNYSISFSSFCIALIVVGIGGAAAAKVLKTSRRNKIASTGRPHR
eukprot:CAMPEP_0201949012 /NCGR_PEP_ID=MMETSP0903-20130614/55756_1 /ASSEMBLY_ACC=CAM_ASM_000552 /TAXON_ID=420261 /ORGANISM="Thalassiosira antarctica, Strain CCMP982" /LENGTH=290 /DNA_ID=CAMNT_0048492209 /DNA_START=25 /DNA_END=898 /DNA_ORIENTATION=+